MDLPNISSLPLSFVSQEINDEMNFIDSDRKETANELITQKMRNIRAKCA